MDKFYVQSRKCRLIILAENSFGAAIKFLDYYYDKVQKGHKNIVIDGYITVGQKGFVKERGCRDSTDMSYDLAGVAIYRDRLHAEKRRKEAQ